MPLPFATGYSRPAARPRALVILCRKTCVLGTASAPGRHSRPPAAEVLSGLCARLMTFFWVFWRQKTFQNATPRGVSVRWRRSAAWFLADGYSASRFFDTWCAARVYMLDFLPKRLSSELFLGVHASKVFAEGGMDWKRRMPITLTLLARAGRF